MALAALDKMGEKILLIAPCAQNWIRPKVITGFRRRNWMWGPSSTKLRTQNIYHPIFDFHRVGYACSIYTKRSMNAKAKGISKTVSTACLKKNHFFTIKKTVGFFLGDFYLYWSCEHLSRVIWFVLLLPLLLTKLFDDIESIMFS